MFVIRFYFVFRTKRRIVTVLTSNAFNGDSFSNQITRSLATSDGSTPRDFETMSTTRTFISEHAKSIFSHAGYVSSALLATRSVQNVIYVKDRVRLSRRLNAERFQCRFSLTFEKRVDRSTDRTQFPVGKQMSCVQIGALVAVRKSKDENQKETGAFIVSLGISKRFIRIHRHVFRSGATFFSTHNFQVDLTEVKKNSVRDTQQAINNIGMCTIV